MFTLRNARQGVCHCLHGIALTVNLTQRPHTYRSPWTNSCPSAPPPPGHVATLFASLFASLVLALPLVAQSPAPRRAKVFISVDMEGLAGVVNGPDVNSTGPDYQLFRTIMAGETNAAIEGAFLAGAGDVLVRDTRTTCVHRMSTRGHDCCAV